MNNIFPMFLFLFKYFCLTAIVIYIVIEVKHETFYMIVSLELRRLKTLKYFDNSSKKFKGI